MVARRASTLQFIGILIMLLVGSAWPARPALAQSGCTIVQLNDPTTIYPLSVLAPGATWLSGSFTGAVSVDYRNANNQSIAAYNLISDEGYYIPSGTVEIIIQTTGGGIVNLCEQGPATATPTSTATPTPTSTPTPEGVYCDVLPVNNWPAYQQQGLAAGTTITPNGRLWFATGEPAGDQDGNTTTEPITLSSSSLFYFWSRSGDQAPATQITICVPIATPTPTSTATVVIGNPTGTPTGQESLCGNLGSEYRLAYEDTLHSWPVSAFNSNPNNVQIDVGYDIRAIRACARIDFPSDFDFMFIRIYRLSAPSSAFAETFTGNRLMDVFYDFDVEETNPDYPQSVIVSTGADDVAFTGHLQVWVYAPGYQGSSPIPATLTVTSTATPTPTSTPTTTATPTATPTGTWFPTPTAGQVGPTPIGSGAPPPCLVEPTLTADERGPLPTQLTFVFPTWQPLATPTVAATLTLSTTALVVQYNLVSESILAPAATIVAWCDATFGPDGWQRAQTDAAPIVANVGDAFGWLAVFELIGPLTWLLPPILITLLIRIARAILSIIKYVKQILPVVG